MALALVLAAEAALPWHLACAGEREASPRAGVTVRLAQAPALEAITLVAQAASLDLVAPHLGDATLTLVLRNAPLPDVLEVIHGVTGIVFEIRGRILVAYAPGTQPLETRVYRVRHADPAAIVAQLQRQADPRP